MIYTRNALSIFDSVHFGLWDNDKDNYTIKYLIFLTVNYY